MAQASFTATMYKRRRVLLVPGVPGMAFCCRKFPWLQLIAHRRLMIARTRRVVEDFRIWVVSEFSTGTIVHIAEDQSPDEAAAHCLRSLSRTNEGLLRKNICRLIDETGRQAWTAH